MDDDEVVLCVAQLARKTIICPPKLGVGLPRVLGDVDRLSEPGQELGPLNGLAEDSRTWWLG